MTDLRTLVLDPNSTLDAVAAALDAMTHVARCEALKTLGRSGQRALYRKAASGPAMDLDALVPKSVGARAVHHQGRNTLPLPPPNQNFQKRFARPQDGTARLYGYNEAPSRWLIGPGYFVAYETHDNPAWRERGGVVVDYFQVPDGAVPAGWPAVVSNSRGLQFFVYRHTRDFLRCVSSTVSIGAAYKEESSLDHYFTLARED